MAEHYGLQEAAGHLTVSAESKEPYAADVLAQLTTDGEAIIARYPQKRSALLPMLHLVQSVDGYVTGRGIEWCAQMLDLSTAEVSGVATFYTQYKRHPNGEYTVGVCTNTLCAIMGGDQIWDTVSEHLGIGHDETTADGKITLERVECNAACDYAPVVMTNWEFFDNQTPESTVQLVDDLRAGKDVAPTRGPSKVCTFKQMSRTLAGFSDGLADEGVGAGPASLEGLKVAAQNGWAAPGDTPRTPTQVAEKPAAKTADKAAKKPATKTEKPATKTEKPVDQPVAEQTPPDTVAAAAVAATGEKPHVAREELATGAQSDPTAPTPAVEADAEATVKRSDLAAAAAAASAGPTKAVAAEPDVEATVKRSDLAKAAKAAEAQAAPTAEVTAPAAPTEPAKPIEGGMITSVPTAKSSADEPTLPIFEAAATPEPTPEPAAPAEDDDVAAAKARIAAVGKSTAAPIEAYEPDEAELTVARRGLAFEEGAYGPGSAKPGPRGEGPEGWTIKGNGNSMLFHTPDSPWFKRTKAEVWFADEATAQAAGFTNALDRRKDNDGKDDK